MSLLTRWRPLGPMQEEMARFGQEMNRLFGRWGMAPRRRPVPARSYPPVNVWEDEEFVYAEAEVPGVKPQELEVSVTGADQLTIKGQRQPAEVGTAQWFCQERPFGEFTRLIALPVAVDPAKVEARMADGVLLITMAKSPAAKPFKVPVRG
jgi:HSP20 family protein